jgi:hypothetical protein
VGPTCASIARLRQARNAIARIGRHVKQRVL